jgi:protein O-mannosyl-transferase
VLVLAAAVAVYAQTLFYGFSWDDDLYVLRNALVRKMDWLHLNAIWTTTFVGHYAPLNLTLLAVLRAVFGYQPGPFHAAQVVLHAACGGVLYFVIRKMESPRVALLAALLFAVHPTNVETVAWINETKSTLSFLLFLLSFWFFIRFREEERGEHGLLAGIFLILSLLSKINTVVAPVIFLLYDYQTPGALRRRWESLAGYFLLGGGFALLHMFSFFWGPNALAGSSLEDSYYSGFGTHLLNIPSFLLFYLRTIFFPLRLTAWHMMEIRTAFTALVALQWLAVVALAALLLRASRRAQFWGMWFVVFLLPVLQIVPNLTWVAERYLYIPAIGIFVLFARALLPTRDPTREGEASRTFVVPANLAQGAAVVILALLSWRSVSYLPVFRNNLTLWETTSKTCPTSAVCHASLGQALLADHQTERGVKELIEAVNIRPTSENLARLGDAYTLNVGDYRQGIIAYTMALKDAKANSLYYAPAELYGELARAQLLSGDLPAAADSVLTGLRLRPDGLFLLTLQTYIDWRRGNAEAARNTLAKCRRLLDLSGTDPVDLQAYWRQLPEMDRMLAELDSGAALRPEPEPPSRQLYRQRDATES